MGGFFSNPHHSFDVFPDDTIRCIAEFCDLDYSILRMISRKWANALKNINPNRISPTDLMSRCAGFGNLKFIRYLYENKCPWNEEACEMAAFEGSLPCLQFLHENGCPWDERTDEAVRSVTEVNNHEKTLTREKCVEYLRQHRCPQRIYTRAPH